MALTGVGFGLGKMMEGVSGGMLAGKQFQYTQNQAEKDRLARESQVRFNQGVSTLNTAFNLAKAAPQESRAGVFRAVQERLNPEGGGVVDMAWTEAPGADPEVAISIPALDAKTPGWKFTGSQKHIGEVLGLMDTVAKNGQGRPMDVLQNAVRIGVTKAEQVPWKAPARAGGSGDGFKVSDYKTAIDTFFKKYNVSGGSGFVVGPDGNVSVDPAALATGKMSAYQALKAAADDSSDPVAQAEAKKDLESVMYFYGQIEKMLGPQGGGGVKPDVSGSMGSMKPGGFLGVMMNGGTQGAHGVGPIEGEAEVEGLPGVLEKDVALAMGKYGMTRDQVVGELLRRKNGTPGQ